MSNKAQDILTHKLMLAKERYSEYSAEILTHKDVKYPLWIGPVIYLIEIL